MSTVLFIQNSHFESLGIEYLSAMLKKGGFGCELFIYDKENWNDLRTYIKARSEIFLFAFPIFSYQHDWAIQVIKRLKAEFDVPVVAGGGHPTFFPKESIEMDGVDFIIRGEGEYPLLNLCRALESGDKSYKIKSLWAKQSDQIIRNEMDSLVDNLDELPFPDRTIYEKTLFFKNFPVKRFLTRRGCPHSCSFCFNKQFRQLLKGKGRYVRLRTPENVIEEILYVKNKYGMKTTVFTDDDFTSNKSWCFDFLEKYKVRIGLPFIAFGKAAELSEDIVKALKEAGCHMFAFGVESGNERIRNEVLKKNLTDAQIRNATDLLHKYGIKFTTYSIMGNPEEGFEGAVRTVRFNAQLKPRVGLATVLNPYLETDIYKYCLDKGLIDQSTKQLLREKADVYGYTVFLKQPDMDKIIILSKVYVMLVRYPFLIGFVTWLIKHNALPQIFARMTYLIFSALRQKVKLNLTWNEFLILGFKVGRQSY